MATFKDLIGIAKDMQDNRFWEEYSEWIGNDDEGGFGLPQESFEKLIPLARAFLISINETMKLREAIEEHGLQHDEPCNQKGQPCCPAKLKEKRLISSLSTDADD